MAYQQSYNTIVNKPHFDDPKSRKSVSTKAALALGAIVVLILGVLTGVLLVGQQQIIGSKASSTTP